jgi:two-component system response regulator RegX3
MKAQVLIIEDVPEMSELMSLYLTREGINTTAVQSAEEGVKELQSKHFDLIVLDINLPGMDGFEFLQWTRREFSLPVIIVSARDTEEDIIAGLSMGADEFVTKPFSPKVLAARVRAHLRRFFQALPATRRMIRFGPYVLDAEGYLLLKDSERIQLSAREFEVLVYIASNAGKPLPPDQIYRDVWKQEFGDLTAVGVYIQRLRRKIEVDYQNPRYIETIHGAGYRFNLNQDHGDSH